MNPVRHFIPDRVFDGMSCTCNSIRTDVNKYNSIVYGINRSGTSSIRIETQSGMM